MSSEQPRFRFEITKAYEQLPTPVEGELRREPIVEPMSHARAAVGASGS